MASKRQHSEVVPRMHRFQCKPISPRGHVVEVNTLRPTKWDQKINTHVLCIKQKTLGQESSARNKKDCDLWSTAGCRPSWHWKYCWKHTMLQHNGKKKLPKQCGQRTLNVARQATEVKHKEEDGKLLYSPWELQSLYFVNECWTTWSMQSSNFKDLETDSEWFQPVEQTFWFEVCGKRGKCFSWKLKWAQLARYELISKLNGAIFLRMILTPLRIQKTNFRVTLGAAFSSFQNTWRTCEPIVTLETHREPGKPSWNLVPTS